MHGTADLPLHGGRVPEWLHSRMRRLGRAIVQTMVIEYGREYFLEKLSDPRWFQSLGCVLGMDWHSSGITTSVMGALKSGLNPISHELGIHICGGRGKHSLKTPQELMQLGERTGLNATEMIRSSRLTAKIDNNAMQDGFQIYLHNFVVTKEGDWAVVQQGLNDQSGYARRYHWNSKSLDSFLKNPHTSIEGKNQGLIFNLVDPLAQPTQEKVLELSLEGPSRMVSTVKKLIMPAHHDVRLEQVDLKRLGSVLALAQETDLPGFEELLLLPGLGPRTLQSLTLVSEVIHGTESRFQDPARFSFANGGKDGYPFPVPTKVYDNVIDTMDQIVQKAKIQQSEKLQALKGLHNMAKRMEQNFVPGNSLDPLIEAELAASEKWGGMSVFNGATKKGKGKGNSQQMSLFS